MTAQVGDITHTALTVNLESRRLQAPSEIQYLAWALRLPSSGSACARPRRAPDGWPAAAPALTELGGVGSGGDAAAPHDQQAATPQPPAKCSSGAITSPHHAPGMAANASSAASLGVRSTGSSNETPRLGTTSGLLHPAPPPQRRSGCPPSGTASTEGRAGTKVAADPLEATPERQVTFLARLPLDVHTGLPTHLSGGAARLPPPTLVAITRPPSRLPS